MTERRKALPAALVVAGSGIVHLAATPAHLEEASLLGIGFAVAGLTQLAAAILLVWRDSTLIRTGAATLQLAAIGAWALSRTVGLPLGTGGPESVGLADAVTVALESLSVLMLLLRPRWRLVLGATAAVAAVAAGSIAGTATAIAALDAGHPHPSADEHVERGAPMHDDLESVGDQREEADQLDAGSHGHDDP